jgi:hypothetical protein
MAASIFREQQGTPRRIDPTSSYAPGKQLYLAGTFNQFDKPSRPFNVMLKVATAEQS